MLRVTQVGGFGVGTGAASTAKTVAAGAGSYALSGTAASVRPSSAAKTLTAAAGSYSLTGTAASLTVAGAFTSPLDLVGLVGWWDASVSGSFSYSSGVNINSVTDQSGAGNTMNWYGFGRPTRNATGFNTSYPAIMFDASGVGSAMQATSFPMGTGNELTVWFVGTQEGVGGHGDGRTLSYCSGATDYGNVGSWLLFQPSGSTTTFSLMRNGTAATKSSIGVFPAGHRYIGTINSSGVMTLYVDGVASSTATVSGNWTSAGTLAMGRQSPNGSVYWTGPIAECGVATGYSDPATVASLDAYLQSKWGL